MRVAIAWILFGLTLALAGSATGQNNLGSLGDLDTPVADGSGPPKDSAGGPQSVEDPPANDSAGAGGLGQLDDLPDLDDPRPAPGATSDSIPSAFEVPRQESGRDTGLSDGGLGNLGDLSDPIEKPAAKSDETSAISGSGASGDGTARPLDDKPSGPSEPSKQPPAKHGEAQPIAGGAADIGISDVVCAGGICRDTRTGLPLRVLPRPFSHVYAQATPEATPVIENIPAFHPLIVSNLLDLNLTDAANPSGWFQVKRRALGEALGWMRAADVLPWRQALLVAYTHPGKDERARQRVLMFKHRDDLERLLKRPDLPLAALDYYRRLEAGQVPAELISKEPEGYVDIAKSFYMLPIIEHEGIDLDGEDARLLRVAAAVPRARGSDTLDNPDTRRALMAKPSGSAPAGLDVVFVMDMTTSMQPYIDATKDAVAKLARILDERLQGKLEGRARFGLVGYRDDTRISPALEFTALNFTPTLVNAESLVGVLRDQAKASLVSSKGYAEEMFAGVKTALDSAWREGSLRIIIIVGDASSHPVDHEQNTTGLDESRLRDMARDRQIHPMAIHLKDPAYPKDHALAQAQLKALTQVQGSGGTEHALAAVDITDESAFAAVAEALAERIGQRLAHADSSPNLPAGVLESLRVDASSAQSVSSRTILERGKRYLIEASGTFSVRHSHQGEGVDAVYCYLCDSQPVLSDQLRVNGQGLNQIAQSLNAPFRYRDNHRYTVSYTGERQALSFVIEDARRGSGSDNSGMLQVNIIDPALADASKASGNGAGAAKAFDAIFDAAMVEYLGTQSEAPKDITAWTVDRDLTDTVVRSMEVRLLVSKAQLSDLAVALDTVLTAMRQAKVTQKTFFDSLQAIAAQTAKDPSRIATASVLADSGLLPAFINSLPYKSEILHLDNRRFVSLTAEERYSLLDQRLSAKLQQYRSINEQVDGWLRLNLDDPDEDKVYPLNLDALP